MQTKHTPQRHPRFAVLLLLLLAASVGTFGCGSGGTATSATQSTSTTTLTATATSATYGTAITFTATVTPAATSGTVTFLDGTTTLGTGTVSSGQATFSTSALATGAHSITAVFGGTSSYTTSTSAALTVTITAAAATATSTTLVASPTTAVVGAAIALTATVASSAATGTVTFYDGTTSIGTATLSAGVATATTSALAAGTHSITAVYGGSSTYATSTSSAVTVTITGAGTTATTTTLTTSATSVTSGASVTLTATVAPSAATGTVTFLSGTTTLGSGTLASGVATLATTSLPVGTDSVTAVYGGDTNYTTSTSSAVSITVSAASSSSCTSQTGDAQVLCYAQAFYATLTTTQQSSVVLTYNQTNATHWSNLPLAVVSRNGLAFSSLSTAQLAALYALMGSALSTDGYNRYMGIRAADGYIATISSMYQWGYGNYFVAFVGTPSSSSAWQLQFSGHHDSVNLTYNGKYTSATPYFIGVEPPTTFTYAGTTYTPQLEKQRAAMYALNQTLTSNTSAKLSGTFDDVVMGVGSSGTDSNYPATYPSGTTGRGVLYSSLTTAQQTYIKTAIEAWVNDMNSTEAATLLAFYEDATALASTYVGYSGDGTLTTDNDYIRIDGPRVWIEFVVQQGVAFPTTYHYHSIWRDKTADYGADF